MSVRALVFGGTGMLGREVVAIGRREGRPVLGLSHAQADITDPERVGNWLDAFRPEVIINCAAFTKVDDCEHNPASAFAVNEYGPQVLTLAAARAGARLVHVSTDYVFSGEADVPYREDAATGPRSVYGESKLAGERRVLSSPDNLVVRTSWLFGPGGPNFVLTMCRLFATGEPVRVVDDQVGCPTYAPFLARAIWDLVERRAAGIVHYRNADAVSWYRFAAAIAELDRPAVTLLPTTTVEFPRPARRPAYSVLAVERFEQITGRRVEPWLPGLAQILDHVRRAARGYGGVG